MAHPALLKCILGSLLWEKIPPLSVFEQFSMDRTWNCNVIQFILHKSVVVDGVGISIVEKTCYC